MAGEKRRLLTPKELARLANLKLVARKIVEGFLSGLHKSPYHGYSVEFAEYREYVPGDDLRYFDWKAYGKTDRLYIKKFHSETNTSVRILLDKSASMGFSSKGDITKLKYATFLAGALSFVAMKGQDSPGVIAFSSDGEISLPPKGGEGHLSEIFNLLEEIEPSGSTTLSPVLHKVAETAGSRNIIIILSDLWDDLDEIMSGIRHLVFKGHEVIVFHVLDPFEVEFPYTELIDFIDMETGERLQVHTFSFRRIYLKEVKNFVEKLKRACTEAKVELHLARTDRPFDIYLASFLHKRASLSRR